VHYWIVQAAYLTIFGYFFEKQGFRWKWFLPLMAGIIFLTVLMPAELPFKWFPSRTVPYETRGMHILAAVALVTLYPIQAVLIAFFSRCISDDLPLHQKLISKCFVYIMSMFLSALILIPVVMVILAVIALVLG
jgi:hypothetical protein